jgi:hypothetical protein
MNREFVQFPYGLVANRKLSRAELLVIIELCHVSFRRRTNPVQLSNRNLTEMGVCREQKRCALKSLEKAGIVRVENTGHRSVMVQLLWKLPQRPNGWERAAV